MQILKKKKKKKKQCLKKNKNLQDKQIIRLDKLLKH